MGEIKISYKKKGKKGLDLSFSFQQDLQVPDVLSALEAGYQQFQQVITNALLREGFNSDSPNERVNERINRMLIKDLYHEDPK